MPSQFGPRHVGNGATKTWRRDAATIMGRLGFPWILLFAGVLPAGVYLVDRAVGDTGWYVLAMIGFQMVGIALEPLRQNALGLAAQGRAAGVGEAIDLTVDDLARGRPWYWRRAAGQLLAFAILIGISAGVFWLTHGNNEAGEVARDHYSSSLNLMLFVCVVPSVMRNHGVMSFDFWLRGRIGMGVAMAENMTMDAMRMNRGPILRSVWPFIAAYLGCSYLGVAGLFLFPILALYHAAYVRCAYHDIFEGETGIKARVVETVGAGLPDAIRA